MCLICARMEILITAGVRVQTLIRPKNIYIPLLRVTRPTLKKIGQIRRPKTFFPYFVLEMGKLIENRAKRQFFAYFVLGMAKNG